MFTDGVEYEFAFAVPSYSFWLLPSIAINASDGMPNIRKNSTMMQQ